MDGLELIEGMSREELVDNLSEDQLHMIAQTSIPWSSEAQVSGTDEDGFAYQTEEQVYARFNDLQKLCFRKFVQNPQINSHVRDFMGSLTGYGFGVCSDIPKINDALEEISEDPRNELHKFMPKYVARSEIEGELFLALTVHKDGFVEVDFLEPSSLVAGTEGIIYHPTKQTMPLFYNFTVTNDEGYSETKLIPSIYLAYFPELINKVKTEVSTRNLIKKSVHSQFRKKLGGFNTFVVSWDRGFLTKRNISHIQTTIEWIEYYENLKKWEIDHKKSSGSYLWVVSITDSKAFRTWLKMTDDEKKQTGLSAKKTPGGTLILPPGMTIDCKNPNLSSISNQDTDIMHMVTAGLNRPEDMVTGQSSGSTFSGVKATRGPQSDRTQDQIAYFETFLRYDFWKSIFFLKSVADKSFKLEYKVKEAVGFKDNEEKDVVMKTVTKQAHKLITFDFPVSEISDVEGKARAYLGVKHSSLVETLGISRADIAKKLGFHSYMKQRLRYETEKETLPDLPTTVELDAAQESVQEPKAPGNMPAPEPKPEKPKVKVRPIVDKTKKEEK